MRRVATSSTSLTAARSVASHRASSLPSSSSSSQCLERDFKPDAHKIYCVTPSPLSSPLLSLSSAVFIIIAVARKLSLSLSLSLTSDYCRRPPSSSSFLLPAGSRRSVGCWLAGWLVFFFLLFRRLTIASIFEDRYFFPLRVPCVDRVSSKSRPQPPSHQKARLPPRRVLSAQRQGYVGQDSHGSQKLAPA